METCINLPLDFQQSLAFRRLAEWLERNGVPSADCLVRASFAYVAIWVEMGYLARDGREVGRVTQEDALVFVRTLSTGLGGDLAQKLWDALPGELRLFSACDGGWQCAEFARANGHLSPGRLPAHRLGGYMKGFRRAIERAPEIAQMLLLPPEKLVDESGAALTADEIRRVKWLVTLCDAALGKPTRPAYGYTENLIQLAVRVVRKMTDSQIMAVCEEVVRRREHPALSGMVTEKLLGEFGILPQ